MPKLIHHSEITEKRNFGKDIIRQTIQVIVDYNPEDHTYDVDAVNITQGGITLEVSKLLHKAEGSPLSAMLEAIDWQEIYSDYKHETTRTYGKVSTIFDHVRNKIVNQALNETL